MKVKPQEEQSESAPIEPDRPTESDLLRARTYLRSAAGSNDGHARILSTSLEAILDWCEFKLNEKAK